MQKGVNKVVILLSVFLTSNIAMACLPNEPAIILLSAQTFEYAYIYPDPAAEFKEIVNRKNIAVVKVLKAARSSKWSKSVDVAVVELLHGWGAQFGRYMKAIRPMTLCAGGKIKDSGWHLAVIEEYNKKITVLVPYNEIAPYLKERGAPDYVYTPMGLMQ